MFESRPFVVQQQTAQELQQPDLKTSLMQAEKYGHHLNQLQPASFSVQPQQKAETQAPIQLAKKRPVNNDGRREGHRNDRKMVDSVAWKKGMNQQQRRGFGNYIEEVKHQEGRGGADNFTYTELLNLADEFLGR
ncbi:hypothetical protein DP117_25720 [Brasilonema sp. UFV-L1]|nr:hypothetical protein [Brasilonema sp. UFV-L1]